VVAVLAPPRLAPPRDPAPVLWLVTASSWALVLGLLLTGTDVVADHDEFFEQDGWPWALRIGAFLAAWVVMLAAMMLPSTVPMARLFTRLVAQRGGGAAALAWFYGAYLAMWTGFAVVALVLDLGVHEAVHAWHWLGHHQGLVLGVTLVLAGAYQLSPLKDACLRSCRSPLGMLMQHYRTGAAGAWRVGTRHAWSCIGCCWALMLVMFATGVGSLVWMLALTAVMTAEKTSRLGARLVTPVGVVLVVAGLAVSGSTLV
jgi:predicted metal-binding membrane protein